MSEWFTHWFGKEYLNLYPHREDREPRFVVRLIRNTVAPLADGRALDFACGSGWHTRALSRRTRTVGLDLSMELLGFAVSESPPIPYVRAGMRTLPFAADSFDLVVNLFTSFGYFSSDDENRVVLAEVSRVLRRGAVFVLDKEISATGFARSFTERVRLFERDELRCLLHNVGFAIENELGDYGAGPLSPASPRAIFFAHRL